LIPLSAAWLDPVLESIPQQEKKMDPYRTILSLRSVRHFSGQPLPDGAIQRILQAARWTGSAKNTQPWQFVVVREREMLKALSLCGRFASHLSGAALGIVLATPPGFALFDAGRVSQNMMLAAWADGVVSCIASLQDEARARELLGIPDALQAYTAISFGYPQPDDPHTIEGQPMKAVLASVGRRPLNEMVHWEKW
jgi:nitroreductase